MSVGSMILQLSYNCIFFIFHYSVHLNDETNEFGTIFSQKLSSNQCNKYKSLRVLRLYEDALLNVVWIRSVWVSKKFYFLTWNPFRILNFNFMGWFFMEGDYFVSQAFHENDSHSMSVPSEC